MTQQTSLMAYSEVSNNLGERQLLVYRGLKRMGCATNAMLSRILNIPINCVTPRIFELRELKLVGVAKVDFCQITGRKAIFWRCVR